MRYIDEHRHDLVSGVEGREFGVEPICRVPSEHGCQIAPGTYYAGVKRQPCARVAHDECSSSRSGMESFFSLLQKNDQDRCSWATREELRITIIGRIEETCHRRERQAGLGRLARSNPSGL
ncbi:hypothetical protein FB382_000122 [Nocardioides ginsengisegetis]|uniref:Uncharacterized protein n=1 Tax=Nocardioides ginsengisegetis TaxID=661491 RepID=A0A7W3IWA9_9ACTN|nr:hypothetical protein [Nocardioides ginsengisegetis]